eukprot:10177890-Prorocentrum_lima.AAC.1
MEEALVLPPVSEEYLTKYESILAEAKLQMAEWRDGLRPGATSKLQDSIVTMLQGDLDDLETL